MKNLTQEQKKSLLEKDKLLDRHIKITTDIIKKKYLVLSKSIIKEILILIRELEGQTTPLRDYLNYKNYYRLLTAIEYKIHELGRIEQRLLEEEMVEFYILFSSYLSLSALFIMWLSSVSIRFLSSL